MRAVPLVVILTALAQAMVIFLFRSAGFAPLDIPVVLSIVAIAVPGAIALTPLPENLPQ